MQVEAVTKVCIAVLHTDTKYVRRAQTDLYISIQLKLHSSNEH